jgi:hypothetical protein
VWVQIVNPHDETAAYHESQNPHSGINLRKFSIFVIVSKGRESVMKVRHDLALKK